MLQRVGFRDGPLRGNAFDQTVLFYLIAVCLSLPRKRQPYICADYHDDVIRGVAESLRTYVHRDCDRAVGNGKKIIVEE